MSHPTDTPRPRIDIAAATQSLAAALAETAVARDQAGGHAQPERERIRASGLLHVTTPVAFGGQGASWHSLLQSVRRLAEVDSALAHLYAFHHLQVATVLLYAQPHQQAELLGATVSHNLFWGNALNPNDKRAVADEHGGGFVVNGPKSYCSGSVGADRLTFSAWHEATNSLLIGTVPTDRAGLSVAADWDAFGQKQTDSGTVTFHHVRVAADEVLLRPGTVPTPRMTLRAQLAQLILVNLYAGLARGALAAGARHTVQHSRPFFASGVALAQDDPHVQLRYGELATLVRPAEVLADVAAQQFDQAWSRGDTLTTAERGEVAIAVAGAKVVAHRAAVEVASRVFELTGANATASRFGLDRFWRNARVHTLHDPVDYKLRDLGRHVLTGAHPEPTSYS